MKASFSNDLRRFALAALLFLGSSAMAATAFPAEAGRLYHGNPVSSLARSNKIDPNLRVMAQELVQRGITRSNARAKRASDLSNLLVRIDDTAAFQVYIHVHSLDWQVLAQL